MTLPPYLRGLLAGYTSVPPANRPSHPVSVAVSTRGTRKTNISALLGSCRAPLAHSRLVYGALRLPGFCSGPHWQCIARLAALSGASAIRRRLARIPRPCRRIASRFAGTAGTVAPRRILQRRAESDTSREALPCGLHRPRPTHRGRCRTAASASVPARPGKHSRTRKRFSPGRVVPGHRIGVGARSEKCDST